jgi:hypothetical protein
MLQNNDPDTGNLVINSAVKSESRVITTTSIASFDCPIAGTTPVTIQPSIEITTTLSDPTNDPIITSENAIQPIKLI